MAGIGGVTPSQLRLQRIYAEPDGGFRVLVDRLWPRGVSKARAALDEWFKDAAPSTELREWFGHRPERWEGFTQRYLQNWRTTTPSWILRPSALGGRRPSCSSEPATSRRMKPLCCGTTCSAGTSRSCSQPGRWPDSRTG
ncbi:MULTISPECIES: DUF488 domain-containing protein [Arthrobacter]|uniref:DUF488 domain-containing protein n=1 Tax=Arthrobacter TaxID=1663 RepID=UPI002F41EBE9